MAKYHQNNNNNLDIKIALNIHTKHIFYFFLEETIDLLYKFANCSGLHLIFGLNALLRNEHDQWNSSNAKLLIDYCASKKYNLSWELGNGKTDINY